MAYLKNHEKALALRKKGLSYSQIKNILGVSKGTLSYWLKDNPLPKEKISELQRLGWKKNECAIERFRETMRIKREKRYQELYEVQKKSIFPLTEKELVLAGFMLYWAEGTKGRMNSLEMANSDPRMLCFFIYWLTKAMLLPREKIIIHPHLYSEMDVQKEIKYWSKTLKIPHEQFRKPYVKKTSGKRINYKGGFGHGTCKIRVYDTSFAGNVLMGIKAIRNYQAY